jgi:hypothetical protein
VMAASPDPPARTERGRGGWPPRPPRRRDQEVSMVEVVIGVGDGEVSASSGGAGWRCCSSSLVPMAVGAADGPGIGGGLAGTGRSRSGRRGRRVEKCNVCWRHRDNTRMQSTVEDTQRWICMCKVALLVGVSLISSQTERTLMSPRGGG